jgi:anaerobic magnesium-protoporphyrin IX monomethyl ester cyclase
MATKSILVNFNGCPSTVDSLMPDNGLASLAGSLLENGHETHIIDFSTVDIIRRMIPEAISRELSIVYEESIAAGHQLSKTTLEHLLELDHDLERHKQLELLKIGDEIVDEATRIGADFIGFKLWTGEGFEGSVKIATNIRKKLPNIKLFAGGPHVDWFMENIFEYTDVFDVLAYGEGEETIKFLADYADNKYDLSDISNVIYQKNGKINVTPPKRIKDLNLLPEPVYDETIYPAMKGDQKIRFIMIDESRGCPNSCYFCIHPQKSGNKWRKRDPFRTVDLIEKLSHQLNTSAFRLAGSNTPPDLRKEIAQELIRRKLKIGYAGFGHVRGNEDYDLLYKSGCLSLAFGVESGSQRILDQDLNKKTKVEQIVSALTSCKRAGILTVASIIIPCPHDTDETIKETLDLLIRTRPDSVTIQLPGLIPGAYWYKNRESFDFEIDDDYMVKLMLYKIKLLLPPMLWDSLPYKLNGRTHNQFSAIAQSITTELEKNDILTGIGDFLLLIAKFLGISTREIRDLNRRMFFVGDHVKIKDVIRTFNDHVRHFQG